MAEYGEWNRKGATLSDATAEKEYGVTREFIIAGIRSGKIEYREGSIWHNSILRLLRSQLKSYIAEELGASYLADRKVRAELRAVNAEIATVRKTLAMLEVRKAELERRSKP